MYRWMLSVNVRIYLRRTLRECEEARVCTYDVHALPGSIIVLRPAEVHHAMNR